MRSLAAFVQWWITAVLLARFTSHGNTNSLILLRISTSVDLNFFLREFQTVALSIDHQSNLQRVQGVSFREGLPCRTDALDLGLSC